MSSLLYFLFYDALSHDAYVLVFVMMNFEAELPTQEEMSRQKEMPQYKEMPTQQGTTTQEETVE